MVIFVIALFSFSGLIFLNSGKLMFLLCFLFLYFCSQIWTSWIESLKLSPVLGGFLWRGLLTLWHRGCTKLLLCWLCTSRLLSPTPHRHLSAVVFSSDSRSDRWEVFPHCGFDLCSCDECRASSRMSVDHMYVFFGKMSVQVSCSFYNGVCSFDTELHKLFVYFEY